MALIQCPECGQQISDKAKMCIHCSFELSGKEEQTVEQSETQSELAEKKNKELDEYKQTKWKELSDLSKKWEKQDKLIKRITNGLKICSVLLFLIFFAVGVVNPMKVIYVLYVCRISLIVDFIVDVGGKIGTIVMERKQSKELETFGKEIYLSYCGSEERDVKVSRLAMCLEVPEERTKRIVSNVISFIGYAVGAIYWMIFTSIVIAMYRNGYISSVADLFDIFFGDLLGFTLVGLALWVASVAFITFTGKTDERCIKWMEGLIKEQGTEGLKKGENSCEVHLGKRLYGSA